MEDYKKHWEGREDLLGMLGKPLFTEKKIIQEQTVCDYGANPSVKAWNCAREEQCDDCFMVDHKKECKGCEHYDHEQV